MTKIICAATDCKYNSDKYTCTAKKIAMSEHSIMTLHDGRQHFWECKQYEKSEFSKRIESLLDECMKENLTPEAKERLNNEMSIQEADIDIL